MTAVSRRGLLLGGASLAAAGALGSSLPTAAASPGAGRHPSTPARIRRWAADTWDAWWP
jgi:hypothetical protein